MAKDDHAAQDIRAWRDLLPGWQPTPEQLQALEQGPPERLAALRAVARGWDRQDSRWDVLMALLVHERREALREAARYVRLHEPDEMDDVDGHGGWNWAADTIDPDVG